MPGWLSLWFYIVPLATPATLASAGLSSTDSLPKSLRRNEPAGFVRFAEFDASRLPPGPRKAPLDGQVGAWYALQPQNPNLQIVEDPSAPASPPYVITTRFPARFKAGRGPVNFGGWDRQGEFDGQKAKVYMTMWIKLDGADYENQAVGTKVGMLASAAHPSIGAGTQGILFLKGQGRQQVASAFKVEFHQEFNAAWNPPFRNRHLEQNVNRRPVMTAGRWHQWEVLLELNQPGQRNGTFAWWIDGELIMEYHDVTYLFGAHTTGFWQWKWNPTWGGTQGVRTRRDLMLIDHVYFSGVPWTSGPRERPAGVPLPAWQRRQQRQTGEGRHARERDSVPAEAEDSTE